MLHIRFLDLSLLDLSPLVLFEFSLLILNPFISHMYVCKAHNMSDQQVFVIVSTDFSDFLPYCSSLLCPEPFDVVGDAASL